jgi:uncharacterized protein YjiS (DUF1127 family)
MSAQVAHLDGAARNSSGGLLAFFLNLSRRLEDARRYKRTRDELLSLTDRELLDVGLFRADIEKVARQVA